MADSIHSDIIIIGGGMMGLTQALALVEQGIRVQVIDQADPALLMRRGFDGRTFAISSSSYKLLEAIGLGDALAGKGCPIERIWVSDQLKPGSLDFTPSEEDGFLGQMFESAVLRRTVYEALARNPLATLHMPMEIVGQHRDESGVHVTLSNDTELQAQLLIVAEGRQSKTREAAGIRKAHWQYDHSAIVGIVHHEKPHDNIAYEIFYEEGPFAILPMLDTDSGRHRSAIVWSQTRSDATAYLKLSPRAFAAALEKASGGMLGAMELAAPLSSYPLGFHHVTQITAERLALIGDSAHGVHPIAGQGLNLGLRDVAALTEVLVDGARLGLDFGDAQLLERYSRWRSIDVLSVAMATDTLNRIYSLPGKSSSLIRRTGMALIQRVKPIKGFFMSEARGESGALPKLLQGAEI